MTLVEVIAALAILVVLSGGVFAFFIGITERRDELAALSAQQRDVAAMFDRLESALMTAVAVAPDGSAGVQGGERSLRVASLAVASALGGTASAGDAAWLTLDFDESAGRCDCTVSPVMGEQAALTEPALWGAERLRFRYLRGRTWSTSFDSMSEGGLPAAIEISLWLAPRKAASQGESPGARDAAANADMDPEGTLDSLLGPLDLPPPEEEENVWIPREPDHVRVIVVPDAPAAGWEARSDA